MEKSKSFELDQAIVPGFFRRLAAMLYDGLLLIALMAIATMFTLPFDMPSGGWLILFQLFLFEIIPLAFFTGFWSRGGQTLGMRAWRLKLVNTDGSPVDWGDALKRHLSAILSWLVFGLGFLWIFVDKEHLAWHDRLSNTRLVVIKG